MWGVSVWCLLFLVCCAVLPVLLNLGKHAKGGFQMYLKTALNIHE
jgi:hypothetical protein|tara:strand:+ start:455 stop:589 length:135 start_codon:yes stop_codon:yes gene_type:complete